MPYLVRVDFEIVGQRYTSWLCKGGTWSDRRKNAHPINTRARAEIVRRRAVQTARRGEDYSSLPTVQDKRRDKRLDRFSLERVD